MKYIAGDYIKYRGSDVGVFMKYTEDKGTVAIYRKGQPTMKGATLTPSLIKEKHIEPYFEELPYTLEPNTKRVIEAITEEGANQWETRINTTE